MVVEPIIAVTAAILVGISAGAFASYMGWNKSGELFEPRKFITSIVTGIGAGLAIVALNYDTLAATVDEIALGKLLLTIGLAAGFGDTIRSGLSGSIALKAKTLSTNGKATT